ncbi:hypothetical protein AJ87_19860 [Rhizobium yanglingense]|nr:hypothetical protein AJ87_19860 [Rhizobium yanglingense]
MASGNLHPDVPFGARPDEIGEMARAVEVFKQNGIKVREMNAQEEALQAKSADLQSSIGQVVTAAVAGDFTQRISKDYDNADLNRFATSVNELVSSVDKGIAETRRVVSALAEGDLTESMRGEFQGAFGELQQNVNATMTYLRSVLGEVRSAIDTINGGAGEMRNASGDLSKRTEQQAASLEETSSALEEITVAVKSSTDGRPRPATWSMRRAAAPSSRAPWSKMRSRRWGGSSRPPARSARSSTSSTRSPSRPTSWR